MKVEFYTTETDMLEVKNKLVKTFPKLTSIVFDCKKQEPSKWISVEEKRPPNLQNVLTCDKKGNVHIFADWAGAKVPFGITENNFRYFPPLWWMPLPQPPKENE